MLANSDISNPITPKNMGTGILFWETLNLSPRCMK